MNRPWQIWSVFGGSLLVVLAAMVWVSLAALKVDQAEAEGRRQAAIEENVRLALWRLDSAVAPLITQESTRPYFSYSAFSAARHAYTSKYSEVQPGEILVPSQLVAFESPVIRLHFQIGPDGQFTSPQVPPEQMRSMAEESLTTPERVASCGSALGQLAGRLQRETLVSALPPPPEQTVHLLLDNNLLNTQKKQAAQGQRSSKDQQELLSHNEMESRQQAMQWAGNVNPQYSTPEQKRLSAEAVGEGSMKALWSGGELLLARAVLVNGRLYIQGCWLDYPALERWMLESIADLLPDARLAPLQGAPSATEPHLLASLPLRLEPGTLPPFAPESWSPMRLALLAAWACGTLAVIAVTVLLWGALSLSERRGAFVSAVTHELRTPLTTFRMYTEMLAEGMVKDEAQRQIYLTTLRAEAERLGHLVENVLAYAGLERGRYGRQMETISAAMLLERSCARLPERAAQAGLELRVAPVPENCGAVRADPAAVERILFNLVDNACKYAAHGGVKRVEIFSEAAPGGLMVAVRDHGPGILQGEARKLFRPFSKSAREAAHSAPGIGLGLALCRRLARSMGGELRHRTAEPAGACFELMLPWAVKPSGA